MYFSANTSTTATHASLASHQDIDRLIYARVLSVNINNETEVALKQKAAEKGTSVTAIVRRAAAVYKFVDDETNEGDKTLQLVVRSTNQTTQIAMVG